MKTASSSDAPIYDSLIAERGNIPADTRRVAQEVLREADEALRGFTTPPVAGRWTGR
ncbi:hypothetical protein POF50_007290 [Streptomyces sp. SL13]|uniref:Uncharacterized protein n=1 Tax=Streptantibioticus silvisoli TaxID=2705255 RepID=A0AA90KFD5_9ACTN|nr:hypothetical protein [Streptantibioticus silvisoli]MDI5962517.1 hypothetical protein [Streptantibioticus silvisoli]MDI5969150.1 hypothetical protein [Streptantibioticus silvisoli]